MKKRIISLTLALMMCFALGVTSFAVEPPTVHQTMMALSPGYEPLAWTNWIQLNPVQSNLQYQITTADQIVGLLIAIMKAPYMGIAAFIPTETSLMQAFAERIMENAAKRILITGIDNIYYIYTHRYRMNDATMQVQHEVEIEIYADSYYHTLIDTYTETYTYIQNLNKSI